MVPGLDWNPSETDASGSDGHPLSANEPDGTSSVASEQVNRSIEWEARHHRIGGRWSDSGALWSITANARASMWPGLR